MKFPSSLSHLLWCLSVCPAFAQSPTFRIESRLVEVPVVVRDRKTGAPLKGLTAKDFLLFEAGKPQSIELFAEHQSTSNHPTVDTTPLMVILIDGLNARFEDQYYAAKAARNFIEKSNARARWAIYYLGRSGLRIVHDYTTDTASLIDKLKRIRAGGDSAASLSTGSDFSQAELAPSNRAAASEAAQYRNLRTTLTAFGDIGRHLFSLPGRKTLVWMSAGFSLNSTLRLVPTLWHQTVDILNDSSTAVYAIDANGVRTTGGNLAENSNPSITMRRGLGSQQEPTQVMSVLSDNTGGLAFLNSNNLLQGIEQALDDSRNHYRLAYRTTQLKWDGRQVALKVRLPGRRGIDLRYRQSFTARPQALPAKTERERLLIDGILSPLEAMEVGITANLEKLPDSSQSLLRLTLAPNSVTLAQQQNNFVGRFDVRCVQLSAEAKVLDDFTEEAKLDLNAQEAHRTTSDGFHYEMKIQIHPDARFLKLAYCDLLTGRLGSRKIELPASRLIPERP